MTLEKDLSENPRPGSEKDVLDALVAIGEPLPKTDLSFVLTDRGLSGDPFALIESLIQEGYVVCKVKRVKDVKTVVVFEDRYYSVTRRGRAYQRNHDGRKRVSARYLRPRYWRYVLRKLSRSFAPVRFS